MSVTVEIDNVFASKCMFSEKEMGWFEEVSASGQSMLEVAVDLILESTERCGLTVKDIGRLMLCNKLMYTALSSRPFWLREENFLLTEYPRTLNPLRLALAFRAERDHPDWQRKLLTSNVVEGLNTDKLTRIRVATSLEDSKTFWLAQFDELIRLSTFPSQPQAEMLEATIKLLLEREATPDELVKIVKAAEGSRNGVLTVVTAHVLLKLCDVTTTNHVSSLLPDVTSVLYMVALQNGLIVDNLKEDKWKLAKKNLPTKARKAVVLALSHLSWLNLADAFKRPGLCKSVFKSIHIGAILNRLIPKEKNERKLSGYKRIYLLQACLRGAKYPLKPDNWARWESLVVEPLRDVHQNTLLFRVDPKWLGHEWEEALAGKTLRQPTKRTVEGVLAQDGNTSASWATLLQTGQVTPGQVLMNLRSIMLLDFPISEIEKILDTPRGEKVLSLLKLFKVKTFVRSTFDSEFVDSMVDKRDDRIRLRASPEEVGEKEEEPVLAPPRAGRGRGGAAKPKKVRKRGIETESDVRVETGPELFRDKKGTAHEVKVFRTVGKTFGTHTVTGYERLLDRLISKRLSRFGDSVDTRVNKSVILFTPELQNFVRSGLPPSIPSYTRTSLWRNEFVCLQMLANEGDTFENLMPGISWVESKTTGRVDLDLSLLVYDDEFKFIDHCAYTKLSIPGMTHSGDKTSAPAPHGARECVEVDFPVLLAKYPKAKYITIMVYSFSSQPFEAMNDASTFVALPNRAGSGPGGLEIISAANLTGPGGVNFGGYISIESPERIFYYCIDNGLNSGGISSENTRTLVMEQLRRNSEALIDQNAPSMRLSTLACLYAATVSDEIVLVHEDGQTTFKYDPTKHRSRVDLFNEIDRECYNVISALKPSFSTAGMDVNEGDSLVVFGGNLTDYVDVAMDHPQYAAADQLVFCNLHADTTSTEEKEVRFTGRVKCVTGGDSLEPLCEYLSCSEADEKK